MQEQQEETAAAVDGGKPSSGGGERGAVGMDVDAAGPMAVAAVAAGKRSRPRPRPPAHEWGLDPLFWVRGLVGAALLGRWLLGR